MLPFFATMVNDFGSFSVFLAILWFLVYWILGGVFFALVTISRLTKVRKAKFSCLFSILALACAAVASSAGLRFAHSEVNRCLVDASSRAEAISAVFGCGFVGIFGAFAIGAAVLVIAGWLLLAASHTENPPLIVLEPEPEVEHRPEEQKDVEKKEEWH